MTFANPWGLLGLFSLPVIAWIHLYHRRFPTLIVGGLQLWGVEAEVRSAGRRRERLPITSTLLLELFAALMFSLLLAQPRQEGMATAKHLIVVLDNSASMSAVAGGDTGTGSVGSNAAGGGKSFRERAVEALVEEVAQLSRGSVVTLILSGRRPVLLAGPAVPWSEARVALDNWKPVEAAHEFQPAWDLATQLAETSGEVLFLTDHLPPTTAVVPQKMRIVSVGRASENVGITAAHWNFAFESAGTGELRLGNKPTPRQGAYDGRLHLRVTNFGRHSTQATLRAKTPTGQDVVARKLELAPGESVSHVQLVPAGLGRLDVSVEAEEDALAIDNVATLLEPKPRTVKIAWKVPAGVPALDKTRARLAADFPDILFVSDESPHLVIGPASPLPPSRPALWWLGIGPLDRDEAARKKAVDLSDKNPYLVERQHPLLAGVLMQGVVWGGVQPVPYETAPLISAGSHQLLSRLVGTQTTALLMNIDFSRSNFAETEDWPIFLANLIEQRRENLPGLRRWNYRINEEIRFRLMDGDMPLTSINSTDGGSKSNTEGQISNAPEMRDLTLQTEGKSRPLARAPMIELPILDAVGTYRVLDGEKVVGEFAINFQDQAESNLRELSTGIKEPPKRDISSAYRLDNPYSWLILAGLIVGLLLLIFDWRTLQQSRRTATSERKP